MQKHKLTLEDLHNNELLKQLGYEPGDEIEIKKAPDTEAKSVAPASDDPDGGGNHPTNPGGKP